MVVILAAAAVVSGLPTAGITLAVYLYSLARQPVEPARAHAITRTRAIWGAACSRTSTS
ncbi:MAG TPA: hypothetical protein VFD43_10940 [Planctomycetota bacterium]|nr:hypothetical protein [Planctomycetota bacterium]